MAGANRGPVPGVGHFTAFRTARLNVAFLRWR